MARRPWTVLQHDPIRELEPNLWCVDGEVPVLAFGRRMTVARRSDGGLLIHSAIALDEASMRKLEAFGTPALLIVPNQWHRLDANGYKERYADIRVLCPEAVRAAVEKQVTVDGDYGSFVDDAHVRLEPLDGCKEGAFIIESGAATSLLFNDAVFNLPDRLPGLGGFVPRLLGSTGGPKVTPVARWGLVSDKAALANHLHRLADLPGLRRIIVGHGDLIEERPGEVLHQVADGL